MLTDISTWEQAAKAHGEMFGSIKPANTFVEVKGFINPGWLVEVEVDGIDASAPVNLDVDRCARLCSPPNARRSGWLWKK